jgi:two-component sensor histidine kinase
MWPVGVNQDPMTQAASYDRIAADLRRRIATQRLSLAMELAIAAACVVVSVLIRLGLLATLGSSAPFITFFPAILIATLFGGLRAGLVTLAGLTAVGWFFFLPVNLKGSGAARDVATILTFALSAGVILVVSHLFRRTVIDLQNARLIEATMTAELQHRVKNTLAVVQGLAAQTARVTDTKEAFTDAFHGRLHALSRAHDMLSRSAWAGSSLREVVDAAIAPFQVEGGPRIEGRGPAVQVRPELALALALCLHELAVNATKHGALSSPSGRLEIAWTHGHERVRLLWTESGGPPVSPPQRRGFGSRLLERGLAPFPGGAIRLDYRPEGLRAELGFETRG